MDQSCSGPEDGEHRGSWTEQDTESLLCPLKWGNHFIAASAAPRFPVLIGGGAPPGQCHF